jgi:hypothetical protein
MGLLDQMTKEGVAPNSLTFAAVIKVNNPHTVCSRTLLLLLLHLNCSQSAMCTTLQQRLVVVPYCDLVSRSSDCCVGCDMLRHCSVA